MTIPRTYNAHNRAPNQYGEMAIKFSARPTFCVQRFTRMLTEIEVKSMDVYQNENAYSKYLMLSTNAVSHYVSLCKIAFSCVHDRS